MRKLLAILLLFASGAAAQTQADRISAKGVALVRSAVAFSATPTFDASVASAFEMTLTGNVTSSTVSNPTTGQRIYFRICQDATGNRTFAWPANVTNPPAVLGTSSACTAVAVYYDGTNWLVQSFHAGTPGALTLDSLTLDVANRDVLLNRAAANVLQLGTGDSFNPQTTGQNLGSGTLRWNLFAGTIDVSGNLIPQVNLTGDIGTSALRWRDIYASTLRLGTDLPTLGAIRLDNNTFLYSKEVTTGSNNIKVIGLNSSNTVEVGGPNFGGANAVSLAPAGTTEVNQLRWGATGSILSKYIRATASLDFTALAANSCEVLTVTATGAIDGNTVSLGIPNALADVDGATERTTFFGWVNAADTVSVRRCNVTGTVTADPAAATVAVTVIN